MCAKKVNVHCIRAAIIAVWFIVMRIMRTATIIR